MKKISYLRPYRPRFLLILLLDGFFAFLLWLADANAFRSLLLLIALSSLILFVGLAYFLIKKEGEREEALKDFLQNPTQSNEKPLLDSFRGREGEIDLLVGKIYDLEAKAKREGVLLEDYQDYVESRAHEIKLPLSLLTLILDNEKDRMPEDLAYKLDYVRCGLQENIFQILFYYRLRSEKKDYFFEEVNLKEEVEEVLSNYDPLLKEKSFEIRLGDLDYQVYTDRRSLDFILSQLINNSIKYSKTSPRLQIDLEVLPKEKVLKVKDFGEGVKACDLPYIFEKGFTGDSGTERKKSTGMGLYLAKSLAEDLRIGLEAKSTRQEGLEMDLTFPENERPE